MENLVNKALQQNETPEPKDVSVLVWKKPEDFDFAIKESKWVILKTKTKKDVPFIICYAPVVKTYFNPFDLFILYIEKWAYLPE